MKKEEFIQKHKELFKNSDYNYIFLPNNFELSDKIKIVCNNHKTEIYDFALFFLKKYLCKKCFFEDISRKRIQNKANSFVERAIKIHGDKYDYSKFKYLGNHIKSAIVCKKHNYEFLQEPISHIRGRGCPLCAIEVRKNKCLSKDFFERAKKVHDDKYIYFDDYVNIHSKIKVQCKECSYVWFVSGTNHLHRKSGCPKCKQKSNGENKIEKWLKDNNINYVKQKRFDDCRGKIYPLPFDFYLSDLNVCIEFDGKQHYDKKSKFYNEDLLRNDNIKNEYCCNKNIGLIRINSLKEIDNILAVKLNQK